LAPGQEVCAEKSNEITAIPDLLKKIDARGGIVTIDSSGRVTRTFFSSFSFQKTGS